MYNFDSDDTRATSYICDTECIDIKKLKQGLRYFERLIKKLYEFNFYTQKNDEYLDLCIENFSFIGKGSYGNIFKSSCKLKKNQLSLPVDFNLKNKNDFHSNIDRNRDITPNTCTTIENTPVNNVQSLNKDCEFVAVKVVNSNISKHDGLSETTIREVNLLRSLINCDNVIQIKDVRFDRSDKQFIITELLEYDLHHYLQSLPNGKLSLSELQKISLKILNAVIKCHKNNIIHRDIKLSNILVSKNSDQVKLCDFGMARWNHDSSEANLTHDVVSIWNRAPEILFGETRYNQKIDIWSYGCILAELFLGKPLFQGDSELETLFAIIYVLGTPSKHGYFKNALIKHENLPMTNGKGLHNVLPAIPPLLLDVISQCLQYDNNARPDGCVLILHSWFKKKIFEAI